MWPAETPWRPLENVLYDRKGDDYMSATEILQGAAQQMVFIAPAVVIFAGLAFADSIAAAVIRIVRAAGRQYRL